MAAPGQNKSGVLARRTSCALRYTKSERERLMVRIKARLQGELRAHRQMRSLDASAGNEQGVRSALARCRAMQLGNATHRLTAAYSRSLCP